MTRRPQPKPRAVRRQERRAARAAGHVRKRRPPRWLRRKTPERNRRIPPFVWPLLAAALVVPVPFLAIHAFWAVETQHLLDGSETCASADATGDCLDVVTGEIHGPHYTRREPGSDWDLYVDDEHVDDFTLPDSVGCPDHACETSVYLRDDAVVAIVLSDESIVPVWDLGWRGATQELIYAFMCAGGAVAAVQFGERRRRATGSWSRVDGPYVSPASRHATAILVPASGALMALFIGIAWWVCLLLLVAAAGAVGLIAAGIVPAPGGQEAPLGEEHTAMEN